MFILASWDSEAKAKKAHERSRFFNLAAFLEESMAEARSCIRNWQRWTATCDLSEADCKPCDLVEADRKTWQRCSATCDLVEADSNLPRRKARSALLMHKYLVANLVHGINKELSICQFLLWGDGGVLSCCPIDICLLPIIELSLSGADLLPLAFVGPREALQSARGGHPRLIGTKARRKLFSLGFVHQWHARSWGYKR